MVKLTLKIDRYVLGLFPVIMANPEEYKQRVVSVVCLDAHKVENQFYTPENTWSRSSQWMVQWLITMVIVSPLSRVVGPQARRNADNLNTHPSKKQARRKSQSHRDFSVSCQSIFGNEPVNGER